DASKCIGCRYCMLACPWDVPTAEWDKRAPKIEKCTHCADRTDQPLPTVRNDIALDPGESSRFLKTIAVPACVKACPADALVYGEREEMLTEARRRIAARPERYVDHIYGEKEAGGTSVLYLASVPFASLGFPQVGEKSYAGLTKTALKLVPPAVLALGALLAASYMRFKKRASEVAEEESHHVEFEPLRKPLLTPTNWVLIALMFLGLVSMVLRFTRGLGGSTDLSDTYPWGLWILFDLVWIAVAAGAFAVAGLIYVFRRKDLYELGRSSVLIGLLSYAFVTVTLVADLGLPWNSYQLALQSPDHSAMFEVSWCVGLYVTILLFEFLPIPLERWGLKRAMEAWRRYSGFYVAFAVTLFVFMLSRNLLYTALAALVFTALAWIFREEGLRGEPVMLAIAAVTLSTMHQSSLGSLYLLMPRQLAPQWSTPLLPLNFFLSSVVSGTAVVILIFMAISKVWRRPLRIVPLAALGQITFWSLAIYLAVRLGDMLLRGRLIGSISVRLGALFAAEIILFGLVPLFLLSRARLRERANILFWGALLATLGVVLNRMNVVLFAMNLTGPMPNSEPLSYFPSIVEWSISIGLIAATIFLFGLAARHMPLLPKDEPAGAHSQVAEKGCEAA
ncbi:MAG TPA: NrfD/PsrC family molybdoenzyme membrane anchor subunit, partial [Thermoanaerobaculia bacterium]